MKTLIKNVKRFVIFLGATVFLILSVETLRDLYTDYRTQSSPHSDPVRRRSCNSERLPESLERLKKMYDDVKTFVMFIGYSKLIESVVGAMLNAHPEILIPQQYDVIGNWRMFRDKHLQELGQQKYMLFLHLHYLSQYQTLFRNKANQPDHFWLWTYKGDVIPSIFVSNSWGEYIDRKIEIIGDSSGVVHASNNFSVLKEIQTVVDIPVKFVHLISNPFDSIALNLMRRFPSGIKVNNTKDVKHAIRAFFELAQTSEDIRKHFGDAVLDINTNDLKQRPRDTLKKICAHLDTTCDDVYVDGVESLFRTEILSNPRHLVEWTKEDNVLISTEMKKISFLQPLLF